ncbi:threonylcarbamoyl-AMP synthase [bacterium]|nr:threonylcarbamoyl-AMP synthase [bacterium]
MERLIVNNNTQEVVKKTCEVLSKGGLVIYPTETCYGIGVDATNEKALKKLLKYKKFRGSKPISIAVSSKEMASKYVEINEMAQNIYTNYLPGPITVVSIGKGNLVPPVLSSQGSIGVRIPDYQLTLDIIETYGKPITATSANMSYKSTPYNIDQLRKDLPKKSLDLVDLIIDVGELPKNPPSTVLDTTLNTLSVLRQGKLEFEQAIVQNKKIEQRITKTPEQTTKFGYDFSKQYLSKDIPVVLALSGELGAGKTQFAKGVGEQLGVQEIINSPTYTIINEYKYSDKTLAHMDTWRLMDDELSKSGLIEHLEAKNIVVIEWADKFYQEIRSLCDNMNIKVYNIKFNYLSLSEREITIYEG